MDRESLGLRSTVTADGVLRLHLEPVVLPKPGPGQLLVRVEAAPINPSDLGLMFGPADLETLTHDGQALTARIPDRAMPAMQARIGQSLPVGNEEAGIVIEAGPDQQHLIGRRGAMLGGAMYARMRLIEANDCLVLPEGASAEEGAALFVNPLTALGFVETMRAEGHKAIVHAPAASNLGQMLVRICQAGWHRPRQHRPQSRTGRVAARSGCDAWGLRCGPGFRRSSGRSRERRASDREA